MSKWQFVWHSFAWHILLCQVEFFLAQRKRRGFSANPFWSRSNAEKDFPLISSIPSARQIMFNKMMARVRACSCRCIHAQQPHAGRVYKFCISTQISVAKYCRRVDSKYYEIARPAGWFVCLFPYPSYVALFLHTFLRF